jgi:hypothetical protein
MAKDLLMHGISASMRLQQPTDFDIALLASRRGNAVCERADVARRSRLAGSS